MNKKILTLCISMLMFATVFSVATTAQQETVTMPDQPPVQADRSDDAYLQWQKTHGGISADEGRCVQQTNDGGYIILGSTQSYGVGDSDFWLLKTDANGVEQWNKTFGDGSFDVGYFVQQTSDNGYILVGHMNFGGWAIKTDSTGVLQWSKNFHTMNDWSTIAYCGQQTTDGGFVFVVSRFSADYSTYELRLFKTDVSGNDQWNKSIMYNFNGLNAGYYVEQTSDNGYIVTGEAYNDSGFENDMWLVKTDSTGVVQWQKTYTNGLYNEVGYCVKQTEDGGYISIGSATNNNYVSDIFLVRTLATGKQLWKKTFGSSTKDDIGYSVLETPDHGFVLTGTIASTGNNNLVAIKVNADGNKIWEVNVGGNKPDIGYSIQPTTDGGYIIAGSTESSGAGASDLFLVKLLNTANLSVTILGGQGLTVEVENDGLGPAFNINVSFSIAGGLFIKPKTGELMSDGVIVAGEKETFTTEIFGIGLGKLTPLPEITVSVSYSDEVAYSFEKSVDAQIFFKKITIV